MKAKKLCILILVSANFPVHAQKMPPFDKIGHEILFVDTLLITNGANKKITELEQSVHSEKIDKYTLTKAYYNLAICYAALRNEEKTDFYLQKSIKESPAFHNLILTDSDFKFLYNEPSWKAVVASIDSIYPTLFPLIKEKELAVELYHIFLKDQQSRGLGIKRKDAVCNFDTENLMKVEKIIDEYGWPTYSMVGVQSADAAFLVIQHSSVEVQQKYYKLLSEAVHNNEAGKESFAMLTDRISVNTRGCQIYGTQVFRIKNPVSNQLGAYKYFPIEDEKNVDSRRKEMGLIPLKDYFILFGIKYRPN